MLTEYKNHTADSTQVPDVDGCDKFEKGCVLLGGINPQRNTTSSFNPFRDNPRIAEGQPAFLAVNRNEKPCHGPETRISTTNPFLNITCATVATEAGHGHDCETKGQSLRVNSTLDNYVHKGCHIDEGDEETLINPFRNLLITLGKPKVQVNPVTSTSATSKNPCKKPSTLPGSPGEEDVRLQFHIAAPYPLPDKCLDIAMGGSQSDLAENGDYLEPSTLLKDVPHAAGCPQTRSLTVAWDSPDGIPEIVSLDTDDDDDSSLFRSDPTEPNVLRKGGSTLSPHLARNGLAVIVTTEEGSQPFVPIASPSGAQTSQGKSLPDLPSTYTESFLISLPSGASRFGHKPAENASTSSPVFSLPTIGTKSRSAPSPEQVEVSDASSRNLLKPLLSINCEDLSVLAIEPHTLKDSLDRALRELDEARQEIARNHLQIASLADQLANIRKPFVVNDAQAQQLHFVNSKLDKAQTATLSANSELQDWKRRYDEIGEATKKIIAELRSTQGRVLSLTKERDQRLEESNLKLQSTQLNLQESKVLIISLTKDKQNLERRLEQMRQNEQAKNTQLQQARTHIFSLAKDKQDLQGRLSEKQDSPRLAHQKLNALERQVRSLNEEKQDLVDRLDKSRQKQKATRFELQETQAQLQSSDEQKQKLQEQLDELQDRFENLRKKQKSTRSELQETRSQLQSSERLQEQLKALQDRFESLQKKHKSTCSELQETRSQLKSSERLEEQLEELQDRFDKLRQKQKTSRSELQETQAQLQSSYKEKQRWQEQLETVQLQLNKSQRQLRSLDHLTRFQLEVRQEWLYGSIRRGKYTSSTTPSAEVIDALVSLNESIFRDAQKFVPKLERVKVRGTKSKRAKTMLGEWIVSMMEEQMTKSGGLPRFLMGVVLEIFMVTWCSAIIEAWYPKRQTFADLLIELSEQTKLGTQSILCGKQVQVIPGAAPVNFRKWVKDILEDLSQILLVAGVAVHSQDFFSNKLLVLVKDAYRLRTALAEKDVCGGLELVVVTPGTLFQPKLMEEAHLSIDHESDTWLTGKEHIAGTTAMGLQLVEKLCDGVPTKKPRIVLKPKVVLASTLLASI